MQKQLTFLVIITLIAITILVGLLGFWSLYPYNPISTYPKPYRIVYPADKIVHQGNYITYEFKYKKSSNLIPEIQRQFVDGIVFNVATPVAPTVTEKGMGIARVQIQIPETLPPGKYHLRLISLYQVNPIRTVHYDNVTETFEVVSGKHSDAEQDALDGDGY